MAMSLQQQKQPTILLWIFDTREWWPELTQTRQLESNVRGY